MTTPLYSTRAWRKFRVNYLTENPLCVHCQARGETTAAAEVDHVIPISLGGEVWSLANLQALCSSCHSKKTATDGSRSDSIRGCDVNGVPLDPTHPWRVNGGDPGGGS